MVLGHMFEDSYSVKYRALTKKCEQVGQSFAFRDQTLIFSTHVCNVDCSTIKNNHSYCFETNVFLTHGIIMFLMSIKLIQSL